MNFLELFKQGGFIMYPLLAFSILIWIVALQKYFFLLSFTKQYKKIDEDANRAITANRFEELRWVFKNASVLITRPHEVLFEDTMLSKEELSEKLYRRLNETQAGLKKNMWILGTIGSSAPFIGLFGTVLGIMESFRAIGESGKSGFAVVAAGISEFFVVIAIGIIVAVVAVIFYNYFQTKINQISLDFKNRVEDIADLVFIARKMRK